METNPVRFLCRSLCLTLFSVVLLQTTVAAAQIFPTKTVRIVVPFAAGGALDVITRVVADQLQTRWKHSVIVENRAGASGNVGTESVARAEPDGHTLLAAPPPPLAVNQFLFKSMNYNPSDFAMLAILASAPNVLIARPGVPASSVGELIALAKNSTKKLSYASTGRGGTPHLTMEWFKLATGADFEHVPYPRGYPAALTDLIGGHVDLIFANLSDAKNLIKDGQAKALGVANSVAIDELKDVTPIAKDIPGFVSMTWFALVAPRGTSKPIVEQIATDVSAALATPAVTGRLRTLSLTGVAKSPAEADAFVKEETERWQQVIQHIGLQPE